MLAQGHKKARPKDPIIILAIAIGCQLINSKLE